MLHFTYPIRSRQWLHCRASHVLDPLGRISAKRRSGLFVHRIPPLAHGPICAHCGVIGSAGKLGGNSTRIGVYKCYGCRKPFTVKVGTVFESSHIKLHIWLQAIFLIASSKKDISSHQLRRTLGVSLRSAWFMSHRIREAMQSRHQDRPMIWRSTSAS